MKIEVSGIMNRIEKEFFLLIFFLLIAAGCNNAPKATETKSPPLPASTELKSEPGDSVKVSKELVAFVSDRLTGKWQRSDGAYILEIVSAGDSGKLTARYFNPNPINVEKAEWKIEKNNLFIRVIFRDVNYPGSTYTLEYAADKGYLYGNYFQAVEQTNFDVMFIKKK
jgi:hypothetical protein